MNQPRLLKSLLIIAIVLDISTLPIWLLASLAGGIGLPGLLFTGCLLMAHIRALKNIKNGLTVSKKNQTVQSIAGLLLILKVAVIVYSLSFEGDLSRQPLPEVMFNMSIFIIPSLILYAGVLLSIKEYNKSTALNTSIKIR